MPSLIAMGNRGESDSVVKSVGPRTVAERGGGWHYVGKGGKETPIMDAILRIDTARTEGGTLQYQGRILFRDEEIPYTVAAATLERHPARWIREFLLRQGKGVVHVAPGVSGLIEIALKFHEPVMA